MSKKQTLATLLLALGATAAWADGGITPTTITNASFAEGTTWYYMHLGDLGYRVSNNRDNNFITLGGTQRPSSENLWCFVGNTSDGYQIYNMHSGTKKLLVVPTTVTNASTTYAYLKDASGLTSDFTSRWDIVATTDFEGTDYAYYIRPHGANYNLCNSSRKMALTASSTTANANALMIVSPLASSESTKGSITIDTTTGTQAKSDDKSAYFYKWTSNSTAPSLTLTTGGNKNNMNSNSDNTINLHSGGTKSCVYSLTSTGATLTGYSFTVKKKTASANTITLTIDGTSYNITDKEQKIEVNGAANSTLSFTLSGANESVTVSNFTANYAIGSTFTKTIGAKTGAFAGSGSWRNTWNSYNLTPHLTLVAKNTSNSNIVNNMQYSGNNLVIASGSTTSSTYTLSANGGTISSYTFQASCSAATDNVITVGGTSYTLTSTPQTITVENVDATSTNFVLAGTNTPVTITNFSVTGTKSVNSTNVTTYEDQQELLISTSTPNYRIPAITRASNGNLIAVADYRHSGSDIGYGRLDLHARISTDNGKTWGETKTIADGSAYVKGNTSSDFLHTGFGDPCLVADRTSNKVLLLSCSGDVLYFNATRTNHQGIARFYSDDNGATWSEPTDISEDIYKQFDNSAIGSAKSMFIGSGRIFQSTKTKVNDYYRLYCSVLFKDVNNTEKNYVIYSDDFGGTWSVLGGVDVAPIPSGANEPKAEELPDGSILCSSRVTGGRMYNIFHFTNRETAEGSWGNVATSNSSNNGVAAVGNSCNGEVMIIPAKRNSDNKKVYLMMQSVPFGPSGRQNVGIYYKELATYADFDTPADLAKDWDGKHQSSYLSSAYSTMTLQSDNTIGFLYEESTYGYDYSIIYKNYSIEKITDNKYSYDATTQPSDVLGESYATTVTSQFEAAQDVVGGYSATTVENLKALADTYKNNPTDDNFIALTQAAAQAQRLGAGALKAYRLSSTPSGGTGTYYLTVDGTALKGKTLDETDANQQFCIVPGATSGTYRIYNVGANSYIAKSPAKSSDFSMTTNITDAEDYRVQVNAANNTVSLVCANPTDATYSALHMGTSNNNGIVAWEPSSGSSQWKMKDIETDANMYAVNFTQSPYATIYMPKPFVMPTGLKGGIMTPAADNSVAIDYCYTEGDEVPALTPLVLTSADANLMALPLQNAQSAAARSNDTKVNYLQGTLTDETTSSDANCLFYKLAYGTAGDESTIGFYWGAANGAAFTNKAYKAYLALPQGQYSQARYLLTPGTNTGISNALTNDATSAQRYFDLQGRRVMQPTKGIYVSEHGGKIIK